MTITRIHQDGFESYDIDEARPWHEVNPGASPSVINTVVYTGDFSLYQSFVTRQGIWSKIGSAITQMRASFMMYNQTVADTPGIFFLASGDLSTIVLHIYFDDTANTIYAYAGATQLGSYVLDIEDSTWRHFAIDFKCDASSGWLYLYIDGVAVISYTGQTDYGDSDFNLYGLYAINATYDGISHSYIDDFYIDNTTGESAPTVSPTLKRFYPLDVTGTGNYAQWHGSDGDQTNNWDLINYRNVLVNMVGHGLIESKTSGHRDSWTLESTPAGVTDANVVAVITSMLTQTRSITDSVQITPFLRASSTDDDGDAYTPPVGMEYEYQRFLLDPSGSAWTKTVIDSLELGIKFE